MNRIIYSSRAVLSSGGVSDLMDTIGAKSLTNNKRDAITGFLICDGRLFFQVLEGPSLQLGRTFKRISEDVRHSDIEIMTDESVAGREFPSWSMKSWLCTPENVQIFMRHGFGGSFDRKTTVSKLLALGRDLHDGPTQRVSRESGYHLN